LTKDLSKIGTLVGIVLTLVIFSPLIESAIAGALVAHGGYVAAQVWAGRLFIGGNDGFDRCKTFGIGMEIECQNINQ
jgi:hypothetical protein